jgi:hypothetical protein
MVQFTAHRLSEPEIGKKTAIVGDTTLRSCGCAIAKFLRTAIVLSKDFELGGERPKGEKIAPLGTTI